MAGIDDSESIQMSQHNNRELWAFLDELLSVCEESLTEQAIATSSPKSEAADEAIVIDLQTLL